MRSSPPPTKRGSASSAETRRHQTTKTRRHETTKPQKPDPQTQETRNRSRYVFFVFSCFRVFVCLLVASGFAVRRMSLRVAVIGVGHLGRQHARILASRPGVTLVAVVDTNRGRA